MHRIVESIEIMAPVEKVFAFISNLERRLKLSPVYKLISVVKLTEEEVKKGTRFRIKLEKDGNIIEYESEVVGFKKNKKIVTQHIGGNLRVTLKLKELDKYKTLFIHEEEFEIPDEVLNIEEEKTEDVDKVSIIIDIGRAIRDLAFLIYGDPEKIRRVNKIKAELKENLRIWLKRMKDEIEQGY